MSRLYVRVDYPAKDAVIKVEEKATLADLKGLVAKTFEIKPETAKRYFYFAVAYKTDISELGKGSSGDDEGLASQGVKEGTTILVRAPADIKPIKRRAKKDKDEKKDEKSAVSVDRYKGLSLKNVLKKLGDKKAGKLALEYLEIYASKVVKQKDFLKISKDLLIQIAKSDTLNIKEVDLFDAVIEWGKNDLKNSKTEDNVDNLKKVLADVLVHVRFPCMTTTDVAVKVANSGLLESDQILDLFTYLGMKGNDKKASPGKSLKAYNNKDRKGRKPPSWFKFDTNKKHSSLTVTDDGTTLMSSTTSYYQPCFGDVELSEGVWEYEIVLQQFYQTSYSVCIGCIPTSSASNYSSSGMIGYSGHVNGWSYGCGNGQKYKQDTGVTYGRTCNQGEIVRCRIDLDKKTLEYFVNDTSQGVAFTDVSGPVRPAISLYGSNTVKLQFPK